MVRIWENHLKSAPTAKSLPVILPIVLTQNAEVWTIPTRFSHLPDLPPGHAAELQPFRLHHDGTAWESHSVEP